MGTPAAAIPVGLSLASTGLKAYGDYEQGKGTAAGDQYKSQILDQQAQVGELKSVQVNAQDTRNLGITLGHIDAVRSAARTDPTSPTGAAVRGTVENTGTEQKDIRVNSIMAQAQQDEESAAYLRASGNQALLSGKVRSAILLAVLPAL